MLQARVVLDTLVCMFANYCQEAFTVECCEVETPDGQINVYPDIKTRKETVNVSKINSMVGINEKADHIANLLTRMCLSASSDNDKILVIRSILNI